MIEKEKNIGRNKRKIRELRVVEREKERETETEMLLSHSKAVSDNEAISVIAAINLCPILFYVTSFVLLGKEIKKNRFRTLLV